jgi:hypothetical protein
MLAFINTRGEWTGSRCGILENSKREWEEDGEEKKREGQEGEAWAGREEQVKRAGDDCAVLIRVCGEGRGPGTKRSGTLDSQMDNYSAQKWPPVERLVRLSAPSAPSQCWCLMWSCHALQQAQAPVGRAWT